VFYLILAFSIASRGFRGAEIRSALGARRSFASCGIAS
jgi:hypothetical protein